MDNLGNIFHAKFLGYSHWFMSTRISQMKDHYIYVYQARYDTSIFAKYLDNTTFKTSKYFYKTNFPSDIIFNKAVASTSDDQIDSLTRESSIHYRACIG